jgi:predicted phage tail protein
MSTAVATIDPTPRLTTVYLVGSLGKAMGREKWELDVHSVAEAIRAININTRGALERYLAGPARERLYKVALQKRSNVIDPQELHNRSGRSAIYIMPTIKGRDSGIGKVLAGIALVALAFTGVGAFASGIAGKLLIGFGTSLILGGITQLLTPTPRGPEAGQEQRQSTLFQGNAAAVEQGGCVPVVYGRALVSPIPISITFDNENVAITDAGQIGEVEVDNLQGGGQQYSSVPS